MDIDKIACCVTLQLKNLTLVFPIVPFSTVKYLYREVLWWLNPLENESVEPCAPNLVPDKNSTLWSATKFVERTFHV